MKPKPVFPVQCDKCHQKVDTRKLGYVQFFDDAARRHKAGQRQNRCPYCGLYCWPDEMPKAEK